MSWRAQPPPRMAEPNAVEKKFGVKQPHIKAALSKVDECRVIGGGGE
eukprot:CAMPEP_0205930880 /NCGR_PEP_ID=MMETSP1325-20131115/26268_1 /ASSEMBLY_ACC=CAM_ASM_000708 /TAXON_ID=236786 /ORGANISM="Florenciella sp., Strain RCC1007" /LENGTH=46 /DNA_ID= /DNA_START= /DNA_END= /DNA_ORIENTATION=